MDRNDLIKVVETVRSADAGEQETVYHVLSVTYKYVAHPDWPDMIFKPPPELGENPSPEAIVDYALAYDGKSKE